MENAIKSYNGTILFVSHDKRFLEQVADTIMYIEDYKIHNYDGNYKEYIRSKNRQDAQEAKENKEKRAILEHRMTEILGKISVASSKDDIRALDEEYKEILEKLKQF